MVALAASGVPASWVTANEQGSAISSMKPARLVGVAGHLHIDATVAASGAERAPGQAGKPSDPAGDQLELGLWVANGLDSDQHAVTDDRLQLGPDTFRVTGDLHDYRPVLVVEPELACLVGRQAVEIFRRDGGGRAEPPLNHQDRLLLLGRQHEPPRLRPFTGAAVTAGVQLSYVRLVVAQGQAAAVQDLAGDPGWVRKWIGPGRRIGGAGDEHAGPIGLRHSSWMCAMPGRLPWPRAPLSRL